MLIFGTVFLSAPSISQSVLGYSISDPEWKEWKNPRTGEPLDFYQNTLMNGCVFSETPNKIILDTMALQDATSLYDHLLEKNPCMIVAQKYEQMGWTIQDTEIDGDRTMITLIR
jgi:hypothetical protein